MALLERCVGLFQLAVILACLVQVSLELYHLVLKGLVGLQQLPVVVLKLLCPGQSAVGVLV